MTKTLVRTLMVVLLVSSYAHALIYDGKTGEVVDRFTFDVTRLTSAEQDQVDNIRPGILDNLPYVTWINSRNEIQFYNGTRTTLGLGYYQNCNGDSCYVDNAPKPVYPIDTVLWIGPEQSDPGHAKPQLVLGHPAISEAVTLYQGNPAAEVTEFDALNDSRRAWIIDQPTGADLFYHCPTAVPGGYTEFYLNAAEGSTARHPRVSGGNGVAWQESSNGQPDEIFYFDEDTKAVRQLTSDNRWDVFPEIAFRQEIWKDHIVWVSGEQAPVEGLPYDGDIMLFDGDTVVKLGRGRDPRVTIGGDVAWSGFDGHDYEIYLYDDVTKTVRQVSDNLYDDTDPWVTYYGDVVWTGFDGWDTEIFVGDLSRTWQVTNNGFNDWDPMMDVHGDIVWAGGSDGLNDIYLSRNYWQELPNGGGDEQPVPEPGTLLMLGTGMIGLMQWHHARKKRV